ncbi:MAG TPA: aminotransferase class V-fold PLP-dependent enzyme, partial [Candidatus Saccharimonadales bacterium]|nr:aminotransferase class V-fold PLP-dependent enzyme [Candidatus Saccharimonadales bacterium]
VFYSAASHYSIKKSLHILRMNGVCVPAQPHGEIDYAALQEAMAEHAGTPAICIANIGTTMTEARDNVTNIRQAAAAAGVNDMFIHCDGALSSIPSALLPERHPFDFADGADSISFSGHKFLGAPFPCGAVIVRKKYKQHIGQAVAYIGTVDSTITGSRNGHGPLMLWYAIKRWGIEGLRQRTLQAHQMAAYTEKALQAINWECWRNPDAITVVIKTPPAAVADKWQLATADGWSHLICMPGMTRTMIDDFVRDVKAAA